MLKIAPDRIVRVSDSSEKTVDVDSLAPYLGELVELSDDMTFGALMEWIRKDLAFFNLVFSKHLGFHDLKPFFDDMDKKAEPDKTPGETIDYLELTWIGNFHAAERYRGEDHPATFNLYTDFSGVGTLDGQKTNWAIEYQPLSELKDLPLKLNRKTTVYDMTPKSCGKEMLSGENYFTLYDVIGGVLDEISFAGDPAKRDAQFAELKCRADEIKDFHGEEKP